MRPIHGYLPLLILLALTFFTASAARAADPSGYWQGAIQLPNDGELGISVTLQGEDGAWSGTIDIPAQGLRGFELSAVAVDGGQVHFEMAGVPGTPTFDGALAESGDTLSGSFTQGPASLTFSLERGTPPAATDDGPSLPSEPVAGEGVVGNWLGALDVGPVKLRLALQVEAGSDGALSGTLDSLDQDASFAVDTLTFEKGKLSFAIEGIRASFTGTLNDDGSAVDGTWSQGGQELPLTFQRTAERATLNRPQTPQEPFPYDSQDVTFRNESAGLTLAGTLVTPEGKGPFPAVLLVTGSGAQDRDETLMGHKPFWVLADYLARRGIASLRYDDRGAGESEGNHMGSTVTDFATDAAAGVAFLAAQERVDRGAIGIVGHSEGGLTGPKLAVSNEEVDFLVLLAPPGVPLTALLARQAGDVYRQQGIGEELIQRVLASQATELAMVRDPALSRDELMEKMRARTEEQWERFTDAERELLGLNKDTVEQGIRVASTPWFRSLVREDPAVYLETLKIPVLTLFGGKDIQVAAEANARAVREALAAAGNEDHEVRILPDLNHLFQHAETGAIAEYGALEETFAPQALELIGDWIQARYSAP